MNLLDIFTTISDLKQNERKRQFKEIFLTNIESNTNENTSNTTVPPKQSRSIKEDNSNYFNSETLFPLLSQLIENYRLEVNLNKIVINYFISLLLFIIKYL